MVLLAVFSILKKHLSSIYVVHCQNVSVMELFKIGLFDLFFFVLKRNFKERRSVRF